MKDLNIVFFGTPYFVLPLLSELAEQFHIVGVVTTPDMPSGRDHVIAPTPVKAAALEKHIPVFTFDTFGGKEIQTLQSLEPSLFVVASYGKKIPLDVLRIPKKGALNVHPSPLPKYRGVSPLQYAIRDGMTKTEVDIILMDEKLDHGPVLSRMPLAISPEDTFETLVTKAFALAADCIQEVITKFVSGHTVPAEQEHSKSSFAHRLSREDGYIDPANPPDKETIQRMIRAYYPWPTVWTKLDGKIVKLLPNQTLQMEGKKPVSVKDFINGYPAYKEIINKLI